MNSFVRSGQKGFTLIEMSIVLVIIGLIIGGILKGQEIIDSARQKNLISQFDAMRASVNTFVDRYGSVPGDYSLASSRISASSQVAAGNGDGVVGTAVTTAATIFSTTANTASSENLQFFVHLTAANLLEGTAVLNAGAQFGSNSALPSSPISGAGFTVVAGEYSENTSDVRSSTWLRVHRNPATPAAALSPAQMYAIDSKTDDGIAGMGSFRSNGATNCGTLTATTQDYAFANDSVACMAAVDILP